MGELFSIASELPAVLAAAAPFLALNFIVVAYFFTAMDRLRPNSATKDDGQVGIKLVLYGLMLTGILLATHGATSLLRFLLVGFGGGGREVKRVLPSLIVGALVVVIIALALLPRTNARTARQPERYFFGTVSAIYGGLFVFSVQGLLTGMFEDAPWKDFTAGQVASVVVYGTFAILGLARLGRASGWIARPPMAPPAQPGPPQGGQPPQGGGYPPQGGGYPPQGGGYPPQGGGGYGQGGGGYNPQGGGGYGQGGGGYNPQGGGGYGQGGPQGGGGGGYNPR